MFAQMVVYVSLDGLVSPVRCPVLQVHTAVTAGAGVYVITVPYVIPQMDHVIVYLAIQDYSVTDVSVIHLSQLSRLIFFIILQNIYKLFCINCLFACNSSLFLCTFNTVF